MRFLKANDMVPLQIWCHLSERACYLLFVARVCISLIVSSHFFFLDACFFLILLLNYHINYYLHGFSCTVS